jgi:hypothetical protein
MAARVDVSKYANGCFKLENFVVLPQGGISRRTGTYYVKPAKNSNKLARLIPFKFSVTQAYAIELGDTYMRFFKDHGQIITSGVAAWVTATAYTVGDLVTNGGTTYYCITAHTSSAAFATDSAKWYAQTGTIYEIPSPYTEAQLRKVRWAQSTDTVYMVHGSVRPKKLTRTTHTRWTLTDMNFVDGPYMDNNATATTLTPAATTGNGIVVTASSIVGINGGQGFLITDIGRGIRIKNGSTWGWGKIVGHSSTTSITVDIISAFAATSAINLWALGLWSDTTGWPQSVGFYEDRLWFGGTTNGPQTFSASISGAYETFSPTQKDATVIADSGLVYTISTDDVNDIKWFSAGKVLSILTGSAEFTVSASNLNEAITPTNIKVVRETNRGCNDTRPARIDSSVLFAQASGRKLREYAYSFQTDQFQAPDMTVLSERITRSGIVDMDYQQEPYSIVWVILNNGQLIALTYNREQEIVGWHRHPLGGTNAKAISICCIPAPDGTYNEVWLLVERTINGATVKSLEYLTPEVEYEVSTDKEKAFFVDCGLTYEGASTSTISGLNHLIGETVSILGNGAVQPDKVVSGGGTITLDYPVTKASIGLKYKSAMLSTRWEIGGNEGTAQGKTGRIHNLAIRFLDTLGCKYGPSASKLEELQFRTPSMPMNQSPDLFTGDKTVSFPADYGTERQVYLETDQPYPCTVLGVMPAMVVYG